MPNNKRKILVHVCCAACASYVLSVLEEKNFQIIAYFYHPEVHGRAEYFRRLNDVNKLCEERGIKLVIPAYNIQDFLSILMPYQDQHSIKYISDKKRYQRNRCQICISLLINNIVRETKKLRLKYFTTTMLCSPYRDHEEIWDKALELATQNKLNLFYKDFRKGYWKGRNYARNHDIMIPKYCGCSESAEERRLE